MQCDRGSYKIMQIPIVCHVGLPHFSDDSAAAAPVFTAVQTSLLTFSLVPWKVLMVCPPLK